MKRFVMSTAALALLSTAAMADEVGTPVFYAAGPNCYKVTLHESGHGYAVVFNQLPSDTAALAMIQELQRGASRLIISNGETYPPANQGGCGGTGKWAVIEGVRAPQ